MENIQIRECTYDDIDVIFLLEAEWEQEDVSYEFIPISREDFIAQFEQFKMYYLVAESDGDILGYVNGSVRQEGKQAIIPEGIPYLEVENIYVNSEFRNKDVGGMLLRRLMEIARQNEIQRFFVSTVTKDMEKILNFYRNHGFKPWYVEMFI